MNERLNRYLVALSRRIAMILLVMLQFIALPTAKAQDSIPLVLSESAFLAILKQYHPVMQIAGIKREQAAASLLSSRAAFDPKLQGGYERKRFAGDSYYSYYTSELKVPVWYGMDLKAGTEEISGNRVTTESTLGQTSYLGIQLPLLNGLITDKRRTALKQAKILVNLTDEEQKIAVNDLVYQALADYWNWVKAYQQLEILRAQLDIAGTRYNMVKQEQLQGSRAAIDTTEALAQWQQLQVQANELNMDLNNAALDLSNYLWLDNAQPVQLTSGVMPDSTALMNMSFSRLSLDSLLSVAMMQHPKLMANNYKIKILELERKLKFQQLLPKLDFSFNALSKSYRVVPEWEAAYLNNNQKFGVHFSMPLRIAEGRAGYKMAKLKWREADLQQEQETWRISNKVKASFNEWITMQNQVDMYEQVLLQYQRLYTGERSKFEVGESNLFLLNSRENKWLEARLKMIDLRTKLRKSYASLIWSAGGFR